MILKVFEMDFQTSFLDQLYDCQPYTVYDS